MTMDLYEHLIDQNLLCVIRMAPLARDGLSSPEISALLFISRRTWRTTYARCSDSSTSVRTRSSVTLRPMSLDMLSGSRTRAFDGSD
jgi:hypothetical protein